MFLAHEKFGIHFFVFEESSFGLIFASLTKLLVMYIAALADTCVLALISHFITVVFHVHV